MLFQFGGSDLFIRAIGSTSGRLERKDRFLIERPLREAISRDMSHRVTAPAPIADRDLCGTSRVSDAARHTYRPWRPTRCATGYGERSDFLLTIHSGGTALITLCWSAKGGSGTTVVATALALATTKPRLLVDLAGDVPTVLGLSDPERPGLGEWLASDTGPQRLRHLEVPVDQDLGLLPAGVMPASVDPSRWQAFATFCAEEQRDIVIDIGTRPIPPALARMANRSWLVTRACYLSVRAAIRRGEHPTGVVLVAEAGRALRRDDISASIGAPVVATVLVDPAIARAVDAGLLVSRLPKGFARSLRGAP